MLEQSKISCSCAGVTVKMSPLNLLMYHFHTSDQRCCECYILHIALLYPRSECNIKYIALRVWVHPRSECNIKILHCTRGCWVPAAKAASTPHLTGGKTLYCLLYCLYSLTCKNQLWEETSMLTLYMQSKKQPMVIKEANMTGKTLYKRSYIPY